MAEKKLAPKSLATLAADLRKVRERKPTPKQIEELNGVLEGPGKKPRDSAKKKIARSPDAEA